MIRWLIIIFILLPVHAMGKKTLVYKAKGGDHKEFYQNYTIEKKADGGYLIVLNFMENNQLNREHIVTLDSNKATIAWKFQSPITKLNIEAYRKDKKIFLTGTKNGKRTEKQFDVGDRPWLQIFPTGLEIFALSTNDFFIFHSIGVEGPGEMEIGEFIARREITKEDNILLSLTFNNWKSTFWKGKSWHRKSDGHILGIHVGRDIGTWEFQSENDTTDKKLSIK